MSDSDERNDSGWLLYATRPEWRDVTPIPQDDGPDSVVAIAYSDKFKDVYNYFRAILRNNEKSERVLELTKDALHLNSANYTVWQYRRDVLQSLNSDLSDELTYVQSVIESNPKNYQVWHHRRVLVEWMNDASLELQLTTKILAQDPKNYHAWQHRQWVIKTFELYDEELDYVESLLSQDVRNNSAWNQRYFVIANTTGFTEEVVEKEVQFTINKIKLFKSNESAWNYLRGVLFYDKRGLSGNTSVVSFCEELFTGSYRPYHLLALLVDICDDSIANGKDDPLYNANRGTELCTSLEQTYDTIRSRYWKYVSERFLPEYDRTGKSRTFKCSSKTPKKNNDTENTCDV